MASPASPRCVTRNDSASCPDATSGSHVPLRALDWVYAGVLIVIALLLFRGHVSGNTTWLGNPDRPNADLKVVRHFIERASDAPVNAWNEHEMMGYDSFSLPGTFPNPIALLTGLWPLEEFYVGSGFLSIALLAVAGVSAYAFLRALFPPTLPVFVAALCYEVSAMTILKVSQNSMTFAILICIPLLLLAVRSVERERSAGPFVGVVALLASMLLFMFLQEVAYAVALALAYAAWRSLRLGSWRPIVVFFLALLTAALVAGPRVVGLASAMAEYSREHAGYDMTRFDSVYRFQGVRPLDIVRWFDDSLVGRSPSDAATLGNSINLTEGFLLHSSAIVPFLLLIALLRGRVRAFGRSCNTDESTFHLWVLTACVAVILLKPITYILYLVFLQRDFLHARVLVAALLSMCVLLAVALDGDRRAPSSRSDQKGHATGVALGLVLAGLVEVVAVSFPGAFVISDWLPIKRSTWSLRVEGVVRIALSGIVLCGLLLYVRWGKSIGVPSLVAGTLCSLIGAQSLIAADREINGAQTTRFERPFDGGDFYQARRDEFRPPSFEQLRILHERVTPERFRVAVVCDPAIAGGLCAGHVPEFWQLRAIDGYYGIGVPARLRALPWPSGIGLRSISFTRIDELPWPLLGFLNVQWALVAGDGVFRNITRDGEQITGRAQPSSFELVASPSRVTPRAFFTARVEPVVDAQHAVSRLFESGLPSDPVKQSFVEGLGTARAFPARGSIKLEGGQDHLVLRFNAAPEERFIVLNELYYPGWTATSTRGMLSILPTNAVMRGILVPAGIDRIDLLYVPVVLKPIAQGAYAIAVSLFAAAFLTLRRSDRTRLQGS